MKRLLDLTVAIAGLVILGPLLVLTGLAIWLQDFSTPFYLGWRAGRNGTPFRMAKFRSMMLGADRTGVNSTAADDARLTVIGRMIRACELDELPQLWNVLLGQMSLVGPRPQIINETTLYTREERRIFAIRPGITDLASIVFSDESEILNGSNNPDLLYHQIIRPWKNRLALLYLKEHSFLADLAILGITVLSLVFRKAALRSVKKLLHYWNADELLTTTASREHPLVSYPPPGGQGIVSEYAPRAPLEKAAVGSGGPDGV